MHISRTLEIMGTIEGIVGLALLAWHSRFSR
jgi:hypothetical protein